MVVCAVIGWWVVGDFEMVGWVPIGVEGGEMKSDGFEYLSGGVRFKDVESCSE